MNIDKYAKDIDQLILDIFPCQETTRNNKI